MLIRISLNKASFKPLFADSDARGRFFIILRKNKPSFSDSGVCQCSRLGIKQKRWALRVRAALLAGPEHTVGLQYATPYTSTMPSTPREPPPKVLAGHGSGAPAPAPPRAGAIKSV